SRETTEMDDLLVARRVDPHRVELLEFVADAHDHVRIVKPEVDIVVAHEADRSQGMAVIVGKDAFAVKGRGDRGADELGKTAQWFGGRRAGGSGSRAGVGPRASREPL